MTIGPFEFFGPLDKCAGLFAVDFPWGPWQATIHVAVLRPCDWVWGRSDSWWDGPMPRWGLGPLLLVAAFWRSA